MDIIAVWQDTLRGSQPLQNWVASGGIAIVPLGNSTVSAIPGRTLVSQPLVKEQRVGLGRIIYLDPSDSALDEHLWRQILQAGSTDNKAVASFKRSYYYYDQLGDLSRQGMDARPPRVTGILGFLGLYILLLVPANYFTLKRFRRKELAWVTIPSLVIIFSVTAYVAGSASREKRLVANSAQVWETTAGSDVARYFGKLSLFSPNRSRHAIEFADPSALVWDTAFGRSEASYPILQSVRGRNLVMPKTDLFMWSTRTLAYEGVCRMPGTISADLTTDGMRIRGTIANNLPFALKDCVLYGDRFMKEIGQLRPGETMRIDQEFQRRIPYNRSLSWWPVGGLMWNEWLTGVPPDQLILSGLPEGQITDARIDGEKVESPTNIAFIHIYPRWQEGFVSGSIGGTVGDTNPHYRTWKTGEDTYTLSLETSYTFHTPNAMIEVQYRLPANLASPRLFLDVQAGQPIIIRPQVYDIEAGKWVGIGKLESGSGRLVIRNPERVIAPGGIVRARLVRSGGPGDDASVLARLAFEGRAK